MIFNKDKQSVLKFDPNSPEYGRKFGKDQQIDLIGQLASKKSYWVVKCNVCGQDSELFGEGYFTVKKWHIMEGHIPCGCSGAYRWTQDQYTLLAERVAKSLGFEVEGFEDSFKSGKTKIKINCPLHGTWTTTLSRWINTATEGCRKCGWDRFVESGKKDSIELISSFFSSGAFPEGTKFWRSDRKTKSGYSGFWWVQCIKCNEITESFSSSLQKGHLPCSCGRKGRSFAYINIVQDGLLPVSLKFGICRDIKLRTKVQDLRSIYQITNHSVYKFSNNELCKKAERECLQELECGVLSKQEMPDGYTETTWVYNLDKIIQIYERNGGVRIND